MAHSNYLLIACHAECQTTCTIQYAPTIIYSWKNYFSVCSLIFHQFAYPLNFNFKIINYFVYKTLNLYLVVLLLFDVLVFGVYQQFYEWKSLLKGTAIYTNNLLRLIYFVTYNQSQWTCETTCTKISKENRLRMGAACIHNLCNYLLY
jgi:hypothetical protein